MIERELVSKDLGDGKSEIRGFILKDGEKPILYPEPRFQSCCSAKNLHRGLYLSGEVPNGLEGQCVSLKGYYSSPKHFVVEEPLTASSGLWPYLLILMCIVLWQGYRFAQKKRSDSLKV